MDIATAPSPFTPEIRNTRTHRTRRRKASVTSFESLFLRASPPGADPSEALPMLAAMAVERRFVGGACVVRRSQWADSLWLLARGSVALGMLDNEGTFSQVRAVESCGWADAS